MKRQYFISFKYYSEVINKFYNGIGEIDLQEEYMVDYAKRKIQGIDPDIDVDSLTINVVALNNID